MKGPEQGSGPRVFAAPVAQDSLRRCVDASHESALATSGLVLVDDTLGRSGVDALDGESSLLDDVGTALLGGGEGALGAGLQFGTHSLVPQAGLLVLTVSLDLALDVGHGGPLLSMIVAGPTTGPAHEGESIAAGVRTVTRGGCPRPARLGSDGPSPQG